MLEALVAGLGQVLSWPAIGLMFVGIGAGFVVGIMPGVGGATALALMLPFIFKMQPAEAFAFLLGMASVLAMTGEITSILFGVPGEPVTAAAILDGHTMAKKGEAGRALGAALFGAFIGAVIGALSLMITIPVVQPLLRSFGSPEFLMFAVLGIAFVSSLTGISPAKGFAVAALGLLLSCVGQAPGTATLRYVFGQLYLWEGIRIVPATLGLFAIPELVDLVVHRSAIARRDVGDLGGVRQGFADVLRHRWLAVRAAVIGVVVGVAPGIGGAGAQWIAYGHAVQSSSTPERFGKGAVEGVIAPAIASAGERTSALIPTVAFGIPGNVSTAVLLGAFIIQGLVPGKDMLEKDLAITFAMAWTMIIANVIAIAICVLLVRQLAAITRVRGTLLVPPLIALVFLGAYAERNTLFDVGIALAFGALGLALNALGWPRAPLILGLVLGGVIENYLSLSVSRYDYEWLLRPGVAFMLAAAVLVALSPYLQPWVRRLRSGRAA
ncbi:MAG TPA: tripartite tricarboxylate transporter permease [Candidatus Limnocylindria bacterium]|nr:tripartite tricarboxylate transporter permease [Candidatus Limnocylindria bacterium]